MIVGGMIFRHVRAVKLRHSAHTRSGVQSDGLVLVLGCLLWCQCLYIIRDIAAISWKYPQYAACSQLSSRQQVSVCFSTRCNLCGTVKSPITLVHYCPDRADKLSSETALQPFLISELSCCNLRVRAHESTICLVRHSLIHSFI